MQDRLTERNEELLQRNLTGISLDKALGLGRDGKTLRAKILELGPDRLDALERIVEKTLKEHDDETNALSARLLPTLQQSAARMLSGEDEREE